MEYDFWYGSVITTEPKEIQGYFISPSFLSGKEDDFKYDSYGEFMGNYGSVLALYLQNKQEPNYYDTLAGHSRLKVEKTPIVALKHSPYEIANCINQKLKYISIKLTKEQLKAVRGILKNIPPKDNQQVYIGELFFDQSGSFGLARDIISIYCAHDRIGVYHNNRFYFQELKAGTNYKKYFEILNGLKWNRKNYKDIVAPVFENGRKIAMERVAKHIRDVNNNVKSTSNSIKAVAPAYKEAIVAVKKYSEIEKTLPSEVVSMLKVGKTEMQNTIEQVKDMSLTLNAYAKKLNEYKEMRKFNKDCARKQGSDFKQVNDLIKQGIIESIGYKPGKGLQWTYTPMSYVTQTVGERFLGRVRVTLNEKIGSHLFNIEMPSYKADIQNQSIGTWHWYPYGQNASYCLGSFEECLTSLIAQGRMSDLIVTMRDYLLSCNEASKHNRPNWDYMPVNTKPQYIIDDSWEVWTAKRKEADAKKTIDIKPVEVPF